METQLVFEGKTSLAIYKHLHKVFLLIARLLGGVDCGYLNHTLDNFVLVIPERETNERIVLAYIGLANEINLPLAPLDDPDKAFILKQQGMILGIKFDAHLKQWCKLTKQTVKELASKPFISCQLAG